MNTFAYLTRVYIAKDGGNVTYYVGDGTGAYYRTDDFPAVKFMGVEIVRSEVGTSYAVFTSLTSNMKKDYFAFIESRHAQALTLAIEYIRHGQHLVSNKNYNPNTDDYESLVFPTEALRQHTYGDGAFPAFRLPDYTGNGASPGDGIYINTYNEDSLFNLSRYLYTDVWSATNRMDIALQAGERKFNLSVRPSWQNPSDPPIFEFRGTDNMSVITGFNILPDGRIEALAPKKTGSNDAKFIYFRAFNGTKNLVTVSLTRYEGNPRSNGLNVPAPWMLTNRMEPRSPESVDYPNWEVWYDWSSGTKFWCASHPIIP